MAAERNVSLDSDGLASDGGHGKRDLSALMRVDSPAARITAAKLGARDMGIVDCRFRIPIGTQREAIGNRKLKIEPQRLRSPSSSVSAARPASGRESCCATLNQLM